MTKQDFIFNGKRFRYPQDFEQEFKPTKWSIRKFMTFITDLELEAKYKFAEHTIYVLSNFHTTDKDSMNFIRQIKEKHRQSFRIEPYQSRWAETPELIVSRKNYDRLINNMADLKIEGVIRITGKDMAELLRSYFGVKLSVSTIVGKIYEHTKKINENNLD